MRSDRPLFQAVALLHTVAQQSCRRQSSSQHASFEGASAEACPYGYSGPVAVSTKDRMEEAQKCLAAELGQRR